MPSCNMPSFQRNHVSAVWHLQVVQIDASTGRLSIHFEEDGTVETNIDPDDTDLRPKHRFARVSNTSWPFQGTHGDGVALLHFAGLSNDWDEWWPARCSAAIILAPSNLAVDPVVSACASLTDGDPPNAKRVSKEPFVQDQSTLFTSEEESDDDHADSTVSGNIECVASDTLVGIPGPEAVAIEMAAEEEAAVVAAAATLPWGRGALVEALDKSNKWYAARVCKYDLRRLGNNPRNRRVLVHFIGWGDEFDEWYSLDNPVDRRCVGIFLCVCACVARAHCQLSSLAHLLSLPRTISFECVLTFHRLYA
jgi:hypothetical protein